jgi:hypothetical protein
VKCTLLEELSMFAGTAVTIVVATERRNGKGFNSSLRELAVREVPEVLALALVCQAELEVVLQQHLQHQLVDCFHAEAGHWVRQRCLRCSVHSSCQVQCCSRGRDRAQMILDHRCAIGGLGGQRGLHGSHIGDLLESLARRKLTRSLRLHPS